MRRLTVGYGKVCQAYAWWATAVGSGYHNAMSAKDKLATYMSERDLVGGRFDPALGPFVLLSLGGRAAELIDDVVARRAPVAPQEVAHMLDELTAGPRIRAWLDDGPGTAALFQAVAQVSRLIGELGPRLVELDVNPLLLPRRGSDVIALDALVILQIRGWGGQPSADTGMG